MGAIMKADLHIHSIHSHDAISKPETILQTAADRGIGIAAITDHDTTAGWKDFKELSGKYPVQVVYGQEIKIFKKQELVGELLGLFLKEPIKSKTAPEVIEEIKAQDGIVSIAHPFSERRIEFSAYTEITNWKNIAIEVRNGRSYKNRDNEMAAGLAERLHAPITAGSDAHTPFEVGNVYLEFDGNSINDLKKAILNKDVQAGGHSSNALYSLISGLGRLGLAA
jgi:predicted metal-dependent phosphoesterase TrpH